MNMYIYHNKYVLYYYLFTKIYYLFIYYLVLILSE
jgi:hypothetical protein